MEKIPFFKKIKFLFKKPVLIALLDFQEKETKRIVSRIMEKYLQTGQDFFILETDESKIEKSSFFLKKACPAIIAVDNFSRASLAKQLPLSVCFVLNNDNNRVKEFDAFNKFKKISFGFKYGADIFISDIKHSEDRTNFKVNYKGSLIPFWVKGRLGEEKIKAVLSSLGIALMAGINLVEISQFFKDLDF